jgi:16S rRNA (uracil1498-N3)-methyltransferase
MARTIRCYIAGEWKTGETITLPASSSHHLCRVLRLRSGSLIELFNGQGLSYEAELTEASPQAAQVHILQTRAPQPLPACTIHLGMSLIKPDRMDWIIQKAVELGVSRITPLQTTYGAIKLNATQCTTKHRHWESIITNAAEQCGQNRVPDLSPILSLGHWLNEQKDQLCLFLDTETAQSTPLSPLKPLSQISYLVGPEGGFSPEERSACYAQGLLPWHLGPRILRAETAALAGLTLLQNEYGDMATSFH